MPGGFPAGVVVADVAPVPDEEKEAFKAKHVSTAYLHGDDDETKERYKNAKAIQYTRWKWAAANVSTYVNVLRAAGHSDEKIQGVFDGRPLCWADAAAWDAFRFALGELKGKVEEEKGWAPVNFVFTGSSVPGFSQNPCKGHRDLPSKITDPAKSDARRNSAEHLMQRKRCVAQLRPGCSLSLHCSAIPQQVDICVIGDGVNECFQALQEAAKEKAEGALRVRQYPSTTGAFTKGMRFGVKGSDLAAFSPCIKAFHEEWSAKLPGGLQLTFAEDDQSIPPWEMFVPTDKDGTS